MSYTKMNGYNRLATKYFELKKTYDRIGNKEKAKFFKKLMEQYDQLAYQAAEEIDLDLSLIHI